MASKNPKLHPDSDRIVSSMADWLRGEHDYQFAKNAKTLQGNAMKSRVHLLMYEVPNKWERFQGFRNLALEDTKTFPKDAINEKLLLQIGQNVLKCAAAARASYVWSGVVQGMSVSDASRNSFDRLQAYTAGVLEGRLRLPKKDLLGDTVEGAIKTYNKDELAYSNPAKTFIALTGLAIVGLLEYQPANAGIVMPEPGLPSGELVRWGRHTPGHNKLS